MSSADRDMELERVRVAMQILTEVYGTVVILGSPLQGVDLYLDYSGDLKAVRGLLKLALTNTEKKLGTHRS